MIALRFILEYGSFLQVITTESEAKDLIKGWVAGSLPPIVGRTDVAGGGWAVHTRSIRGVHTLPIEPPPQQPFTPTRTYPGSPWSGN